jgi:putative acetyltransferase
VRGRRIGRAILDRLEQEARQRGISRLVLETGDVLHSAIALYKHAGFMPCEVFGAYLKMPDSWIRRSVFMEKRLS